MDAGLRAKWIAALRSGEFKQGMQSLRTMDNQYCCLGVLCEVYDPLGWDVRSHSDYIYNYLGAKPASTVIGQVSSTSYIPVLMKERINMSSDQEVDLVDMNDKEGKSFTEIADWIEQNVPST